MIIWECAAKRWLRPENFVTSSSLLKYLFIVSLSYITLLEYKLFKGENLGLLIYLKHLNTAWHTGDIKTFVPRTKDFPGSSVVRNPPAYARDTGSILVRNSTHMVGQLSRVPQLRKPAPEAHTHEEEPPEWEAQSATLAREQPPLTTSRESLHAAPRPKRGILNIYIYLNLLVWLWTYLFKKWNREKIGFLIIMSVPMADLIAGCNRNVK